MVLDEQALAAMHWARHHVPDVLRTFMGVARVSQESLGSAIGLTQSQMSRRLLGRSDFSQQEVAALASIFGVEVATFYKAMPDAVADLMGSARLDELRSGSSVLVAA